LEDRSEAIVARARRVGPLMVFSMGDSFRTIPLSERAHERIKSDQIVGVYDGNCDPAWLAEDLHYFSGLRVAA
jgi:hypothetical protein